MQLYVGNLEYSVTEEDLKELFSKHGSVESVAIVIDRMTQKSKGFGFIVMPNDAEAKVAIEKLNQYKLNGRTIEVNEARPRSPSQNQPFRSNNGPRRNSYGRSE